MNIKKRKIYSIVVVLMFLFVMFASLFYVVKEANHNCTGEDCPICASIHVAEQTLKTVSNDSLAVSLGFIWPLLLVLSITGYSTFVYTTSLVSQKVRLND